MTTLLVVVASAVLLQLNAEGDAPAIVRNVPAQTTQDEALDSAVREWVGEEDGGQYHYNLVDLNDDGSPEALVYLSGNGFCGSGGCALLVLGREGERYRAVSWMTLARVPVIVSDEKSNGWSDLILRVAGGGIIQSSYRVLEFDGVGYPTNPSVDPAYPLRGVARGTAYLVGAGLADAGVSLTQ